jgi:hypothetical protein
MKQQPSRVTSNAFPFISKSRSWTDDTVLAAGASEPTGREEASAARASDEWERVQKQITTATVNYELFLPTLEFGSSESNEERLYNSCGNGVRGRWDRKTGREEGKDC